MKELSIDKLRRVAARIRKEDLDDRDETYLRNYPYYLHFFKENPPTDKKDFIVRAGLVYSWMPRVLVLDFSCLEEAVGCLQKVRAITQPDSILDLRAVAKALNGSFIGMSKLFHFENPQIFPIFDTKVYRFVYGISAKEENLYPKANKLDVYEEYLKMIHRLVSDTRFESEVHEPVNQFFKDAFGYSDSVTPIRAAEYLMFMGHRSGQN